MTDTYKVSLQKIRDQLKQIHQALASCQLTINQEAKFGHTTRGQIAEWASIRQELREVMASQANARQTEARSHDSRFIELAGRMNDMADSIAELTSCRFKPPPPPTNAEKKKATRKRTAARRAKLNKMKELRDELQKLESEADE